MQSKMQSKSHILFSLSLWRYRRTKGSFFMITIKLHDEGDVYDVTITFPDDEACIAHEFPTKNDAEDFARRAADLFEDVDDVQVITLRSSSRRPSDGVSEQTLLRH